MTLFWDIIFLPHITPATLRQLKMIIPKPQKLATVVGLPWWLSNGKNTFTTAAKPEIPIITHANDSEELDVIAAGMSAYPIICKEVQIIDNAFKFGIVIDNAFKFSMSLSFYY